MLSASLEPAPVGALTLLSHPCLFRGTPRSPETPSGGRVVSVFWGDTGPHLPLPWQLWWPRPAHPRKPLGCPGAGPTLLQRSLG